MYRNAVQLSLASHVLAQAKVVVLSQWTHASRSPAQMHMMEWIGPGLHQDDDDVAPPILGG